MHQCQRFVRAIQLEQKRGLEVKSLGERRSSGFGCKGGREDRYRSGASPRPGVRPRSLQARQISVLGREIKCDEAFEQLGSFVVMPGDQVRLGEFELSGACELSVVGGFDRRQVEGCVDDAVKATDREVVGAQAAERAGEFQIDRRIGGVLR